MTNLVSSGTREALRTAPFIALTIFIDATLGIMAFENCQYSNHVVYAVQFLDLIIELNMRLRIIRLAPKITAKNELKTDLFC